MPGSPDGPVWVLFIRVPDYIGDLKRDPNLEDCPDGPVGFGACRKPLQFLFWFNRSYIAPYKVK